MIHTAMNVDAIRTVKGLFPESDMVDVVNNQNCKGAVP
jgi:hypothetical protein